MASSNTLPRTLPIQPAESTPIYDGVRYARNQRKGLQRFLNDGQLPIGNNISERELRRQAVGRKIGFSSALTTARAPTPQQHSGGRVKDAVRWTDTSSRVGSGGTCTNWESCRGEGRAPKAIVGTRV